MEPYLVSLEVAGPVAIFTRPDTGGAPTSYPVPTWSAAKGILESIAFFSDGAAWICPTKVEVCRRVGESGGRVYFQRYATNYGGPLRKPDLFRKGAAVGGSSMQLFATVLSHVCYRLHGEIIGPRWQGRVNPRHHLKDLFDRRLLRGECFQTPCLGWSEFTCSFWGPPRSTSVRESNGVSRENAAWKRYCQRWGRAFRDETEVDSALSFDIPSMLLGVWDAPASGRYAPRFRQNVSVREGVLQYKAPEEWCSKRDREVTSNAQ